MPEDTRKALRGYGLGSHPVVDQLFYDMIGARREGVEFLDFHRWIRNFLNATEAPPLRTRPRGDPCSPLCRWMVQPPPGPVTLELGKRAADPVVTGSGPGESAVPKEMRDRVRGEIVRRTGKRDVRKEAIEVPIQHTPDAGLQSATFDVSSPMALFGGVWGP